MARDLMNAAVIHYGCPGLYAYRLATVEEPVAFLQAGEVLNSIVYPDTLTWVKQVSGQRFIVPPEEARMSTLQPTVPGDVLLQITRAEPAKRRPRTPRPEAGQP